MDSITHIALGACIGELFVGGKVGRKAMLWGAVAQSFPDIDFIAGFWMDTTNELLAHRGFTHSLLFAALLTPILALLAERWHRPHNISLGKWTLFFGTEILLHIFLDAFNAYGTAWFEPFSHIRFSFHTLFVAEPLFSIWIGIAFVALLFIKKNRKKRKAWSLFGLGMCLLYLLISVGNKVIVERDVAKALTTQQIKHTRYFTTPTPLNNLLWFIVAENDSGFNIGYRSVFDRKPIIHFEYFPRNTLLTDSIKLTRDFLNLIRFSQGYYTIEKWNDTLVFNDLRFGQMIGWKDPRARFSFHYFLQYPDQNDIVVQRGRFANWDRAAFKSLFERIKGN
ncbi:MAG TPA: metal-dependent hydrolase [Flavitalea sp.]|nr:metal-dependent hydrolase [Flavitalea sp.]